MSKNSSNAFLVSYRPFKLISTPMAHRPSFFSKTVLPKYNSLLEPAL